MKTAKLFATGGSQAVRLPKEFRFEVSEVYVVREENRVVLIPKEKRRWPRGFFQTIRIRDSRFKRPHQPEAPPVKELG
ncbi:MAG: AbrB/MazE/SpoVT family DNA-binding domain-containing protein [Chthoniobacterales bacterium]